ncbi:MAG: extracellular solute-binding protein, partial [Salana multivorans]|nr:extracellular solute-binding protein [Salana multivorans]
MHSRTTRLSSIVAAAAVGVLTLAACSGGSPSGGGSGTDGGSSGGTTDSLTLHTSWLDGEPRTGQLRKVLEEFTAETGITVELLQNGNELNQVYETAVLAGDEADVVLTNLTDKQLEWAKSGAVAPVNDYIEAWGLADVIPEDAVTDWTDGEGNVRGFPYTGFSWPVWYNTDLLDKAGVTEIPRTIDELVAAADALRAAGIQPLTIGGSDWSGQKMLLMVVQSMMTNDEAREVLVNGGYCESPNAMAGIELFVELRDAGVFADGAEGLTADLSTAAYLEGQAGIGFIGSWAFLDATDELAASTTLGGFPLADGSPFDKPTAFRGLTGGGWYVSQNGLDKLDAVEKLVTYMYREDVLGQIIDQTAVITVVPVAPEVAANAGNELMAAAL